MKIIAIGDIHGRTQWKKIDFTEADKVVFLGDYFDPYSWGNSTQDLIDNFLEIVELKKKEPEKFILLLGNHDCGQYTNYPVECDCRTVSNARKVREIFLKEINLFDFAWQYENILFTHAGLCGEFWDDYLDHPVELTKIGDYLNSLKSDPSEVKRLGWCGPVRWGWDPCSGIFWADMMETSNDTIPGLSQVIGHTRTIAYDSEEPLQYTNKDKINKNWYIDSLENGYYLEWDPENEFIIKKIIE